MDCILEQKEYNWIELKREVGFLEPFTTLGIERAFFPVHTQIQLPEKWIAGSDKLRCPSYNHSNSSIYGASWYVRIHALYRS